MVITDASNLRQTPVAAKSSDTRTEDPPGTITYLASSRGDYQSDQPGPGEPPGSAAYYGTASEADATQVNASAAPLIDVSVGELPGSPSYFGHATQQHTRVPEEQRSRSSVNVVGEPPGSAAYFGTTA